MRLNRNLLLLFIVCFGFQLNLRAQQPDTLKPISVDPELEAIFNNKTPKEYIIAGITVSGSKTFDSALLVSITGIAIGDKVYLPGGDLFSKAISSIWRQQYFDDATIYITRVDGKDIYIEINVTERARLGSFFFKGVKKTEEDDLKEKIGLSPNKVITENLRRTSIERIEKYYIDKGYMKIISLAPEVL